MQTSVAASAWTSQFFSAKFLKRARPVASRTLATNSERVLSALWGKLAAEILMQQWETALDDIQKLRDIIDANTFAPILQQLQQRVWLMHWSLFVFFEHENGRNAIIDLFFQDRYLLKHPDKACKMHAQALSRITSMCCSMLSQAVDAARGKTELTRQVHHNGSVSFVTPSNHIDSLCKVVSRNTWEGREPQVSKAAALCRYLNALQTTAQHLLRYLAAAVVVNKRRRNAMKDLIRVIEQEAYEYSDPITQFLECLFVRYDFEGAQVRSHAVAAVSKGPAHAYCHCSCKDNMRGNNRDELLVCQLLAMQSSPIDLLWHLYHQMNCAISPTGTAA